MIILHKGVRKPEYIRFSCPDCGTVYIEEERKCQKLGPSLWDLGCLICGCVVISGEKVEGESEYES